MARLTLGAGLALATLVVGLTALRVRNATTPPRSTAPSIDFQAMGLVLREVDFPAADGLKLRGWLLDGRPGYPPVVLSHDWGGSKSSLLTLAMSLNEAGFATLLFDFRGHGASAGGRSTFGLAEQRDVLGALDYARRLEGADGARAGVYGVGMGAYAAVLAAQERQSVRVLVLDGLYPDAQFAVLRHFYGDWGGALPRPAFLPVGVFALMTGTRPSRQRADEALLSLTGRDLLFLAPEGDIALAREIERMYGAIPLQPDVDPNLVKLPADTTGGRYGEDLARHNLKVTEFFGSRLRPLSAGDPD